MVGRKPLLTFNPFARPGCNQGIDGPRDRAGVLAWARERTRCRPAGLRAPVARPPRLTSAEWRAFHALARGRRAEAARRAAGGAGAGR